jgi:riboflavin synthase
MFTGLIREMATVVGLEGDVLELRSKYTPKIGDSIAVNGVCLTVIKLTNNGFKVEISPETKSKIALENYKDKVHIEPAMKLSDRLEGHIVQGHVDTIGTVEKIEKLSNSYNFYIKIDPKFIKLVAPKGSIAVDGVSLTVNDVYQSSFRLTIIPHTVENTLFKSYRVGSRVNIETDMFARYIYHIFGKKDESLSWEKIDSIMARF